MIKCGGLLSGVNTIEQMFKQIRHFMKKNSLKLKRNDDDDDVSIISNVDVIKEDDDSPNENCKLIQNLQILQ